MDLIAIILGIIAPLSPEIMLAAIVAGILMGGIYNYSLGLPRGMVYHKLIAGWTFILMMFLFRTLSIIIKGGVLTSPLGWIGIGLLWGTFCLFIVIGQEIREYFQKR